MRRRVISGATAAVLTTALAMSYIEVLTVVAKGEKDGKYPDLSNIETLMRKKMQERLKMGTKDRDVKEVLENLKKSNPLKKWLKNRTQKRTVSRLCVFSTYLILDAGYVKRLF